MNRRSHSLATVLLGVTLACGVPPAVACGEGAFNMGQGLRYQGYLAPRPATVLVYDDRAGDHRALYAGLQKAGHRVTVASTPTELAQAFAKGNYEVVITDFEQVDAVQARTGSSAGGPSLLPVVSRQARNQPALRERFKLFLLEGASLGQYLKLINQLVQARAQ